MATNKDFIVKNGLSVGEDISVSGSVTSHLQFDDTVQAQFGTDSDAFVAHSGSEFQINNSTGQLDLRSVTRIILTASGSETMITATAGGSVILSNSGNPKLETTSTGVDITGNAVLTGELRGPASFVLAPSTVGDNTGTVVIKGDLTVEGTTTTVNSTQLDVVDKNITVAKNSANAAAASGAGLTVDVGTNSPAVASPQLTYDAVQDRWQMNKGLELLSGSPLVVGTGTTDVGRIENSAGIFNMTAYTGRQIAFGNDTNGEHVRIDANGQVGIGIQVPSVALDVSGDIEATGTITGSDFSGITMGGSLSGAHDDAKVQYGTAFVGTAAQGHFFFDSLNQKLKVYTGSAFVDAVPASGGGGGGSGSSDATATFRKYTYTLTGTTNAISGMEDDIVATTNFISGRKYQITTVGNTDFTAIGASSNAIGVVFVSTGVGAGSTGRAREVLFYATGGTQNIEVYVNGVKAVEGSSNDYVATTGTSVTFTSNLSSGDVVDIQVYELLTNASYYLKSETYTQAHTIAGFVAKSGDTMTGNLAVEKSANPIISVTETGAGAVTIQGTGSGGRVYSNSGNKLLLGADGQNSHLIINTAGNVGIGTDEPDQPLHVKGTRPVRLERAGVGEFEITIDNVVTGDSLDFVVEPVSGSVSAGFQVRTRQTDGTLLSSFSVDHDGKVGIGTIAPEGGLHLHNYGSQYAELILERGSTGVEAKFDIKPYAGSLYIREYTTSGDNSTNDIIQITDAGHFLPISTSQDIGSTTKPWRNIYTQDLVLSNEKRETGNDVDGTKGNWTIQEGEEHLYIINNKSGKKYKFALEEIE